MKLKARSRLAKSTTEGTSGLTSSLGSRRSGVVNFQLPSALPFWWVKRQPKLISLLIGLGLYAYVGYVLTHVFPDQVRDWLIPGSFLPVLGLTALGHLYFWSFVTLSTRRAVLISLLLSWLLWLPLHQFEVSWEVIIASLGMWLGIELLVTIIARIKSRKSI